MRTVSKTLKKLYRVISHEEYLTNQRQANLSRQTKEIKLKPLPKASILTRSF